VALHDWLTRHDSFAYARAQARFYAREAQAQLAGLADGPAKDALAALAEFAVARSG
jgi:geranylgeranyl pyrophosphate synthase